MYKPSFLSIGILILLAAQCSCLGKLDKAAYIEWVRDSRNGLHITKEAGDFVFDLQYQPSDYVLLQRTGGVIAKSEYSQRRADIEHLQYYVLTIYVADGQSDFVSYNVADEDEKKNKLYYLSFQFQNDICLEQNGQRLSSVLFHFERDVNVRGGRSFVLSFENPHPELTETVLIINSEYLGKEPIKLQVIKENIPALQL